MVPPNLGIGATQRGTPHHTLPATLPAWSQDIAAPAQRDQEKQGARQHRHTLKSGLARVGARAVITLLTSEECHALDVVHDGG